MNEQKTLKVGDVLDLTIENLAFGGEGVARMQVGEKAFVIFVEDTVPGDKVRIRIAQKKHNFAKGFVQEIIEPSALRIKPRCRHFGPPELKRELNNEGARLCAAPPRRGAGDSLRSSLCGGCTWQFLAYEQQLQFKEQQVRDAIKRIGGIEKDVVLPIIGTQSPWYYRNKMEFSFSKALDGSLGLGLHLRRRYYDVTELTECFLLEPYVGKMVGSVRDFFRELEAQKTLDPELMLYSFTIRQSKYTRDLMLIITAENGRENFMAAFKDHILNFCEKENIPLTSFYFVHAINKKGQRRVAHEHLIYGQEVIKEELHLPDDPQFGVLKGKPLTFEISPQAFFQPNTITAETLYRRALEGAQLSGDETVFDLFCGTGTIGIFCAHRSKKVYGIELNASAIENAKKNAALNHIDNIEFFVGDVEKLLQNLPRPDVVMVDPPRNGLQPKTVQKIAEFKPRRIVYVSCNPTSLARDLGLFTKTGYSLESVQPVDMFPQTYHIENVAVLSA